MDFYTTDHIMTPGFLDEGVDISGVSILGDHGSIMTHVSPAKEVSRRELMSRISHVDRKIQDLLEARKNMVDLIS